MKLYHLALRNIKMNFKKYIMFFFSLNFSVFTIYTFLALMDNQQVAAAFIYDNRYRSMLMTFGVIIMVFVMFFLISSNNSFIKARKKEISTYSLFGMTNGRIGKLIFLETIIVGFTSLTVGIAVGIFFSKLMAMLLLDISMASFTGNITFTIERKAIYTTAIMFVSIFSLMGLSGFWVINKFELVDLFKAEKQSEGKSEGSYLVLTLSLLLIGIGYYIAYSGNAYTVVMMALPILGLVVVGTYLFFWGGLPKVLSLIKKNRTSYYQGVNLISTASFSHRMKSIGSVMATIAVLSAVATTAIATGFTLYKNSESNVYDMVGYDLYFYDNENSNLLEDVEKSFENHNVQITDRYTVSLYRAYPELESIIVNGIKYYEKGDYFRVYSQSVYNELIRLSKDNQKPVEVQMGEGIYILQARNEYMEEIMKGKSLGFSDLTIEIKSILTNKYLQFGSIHTLVLNDEDFEQLTKGSKLVREGGVDKGYLEAHLFSFDDALKRKDLNDALNYILYHKAGGYRTAYNHYNEARETFGLVCFIGYFMSAVFILMTASLLYFKQIMAAEEERHQYKILRKIGMDIRTEQKVIVKRLLPVFVIPLVVGIIHSIFAMKTADTMVFSQLISTDHSYLTVLSFSAMMYAAYGIVYGIFYVITKGQYSKIVK